MAGTPQKCLLCRRDRLLPGTELQYCGFCAPAIRSQKPRTPCTGTAYRNKPCAELAIGLQAFLGTPIPHCPYHITADEKQRIASNAASIASYSPPLPSSLQQQQQYIEVLQGVVEKVCRDAVSQLLLHRSTPSATGDNSSNTALLATLAPAVLHLLSTAAGAGEAPTGTAERNLGGTSPPHHIPGPKSTTTTSTTTATKMEAEYAARNGNEVVNAGPLPPPPSSSLPVTSSHLRPLPPNYVLLRSSSATATTTPRLERTPIGTEHHPLGQAMAGPVGVKRSRGEETECDPRCLEEEEEKSHSGPRGPVRNRQTPPTFRPTGGVAEPPRTGTSFFNPQPPTSPSANLSAAANGAASAPPAPRHTTAASAAAAAPTPDDEPSPPSPPPSDTSTQRPSTSRPARRGCKDRSAPSQCGQQSRLGHNSSSGMIPPDTVSRQLSAARAEGQKETEKKEKDKNPLLLASRGAKNSNDGVKEKEVEVTGAATYKSSSRSASATTSPPAAAAAAKPEKGGSASRLSAKRPPPLQLSTRSASPSPARAQPRVDPVRVVASHVPPPPTTGCAKNDGVRPTSSPTKNLLASLHLSHSNASFTRAWVEAQSQEPLPTPPPPSPE